MNGAHGSPARARRAEARRSSRRSGVVSAWHACSIALWALVGFGFFVWVGIGGSSRVGQGWVRESSGSRR